LQKLLKLTKQKISSDALAVVVCAPFALMIEQVEELALSQETAPQTHSTQRQIARQIGISVASLNAIIKKDLKL